MFEENKNNRYQIYDLNNNLLVDDIIVSFKKRELMNPLNGKGYLISFDDKHFFNMEAKGLVYEKIEDEENSFKRIEFNINKFHKYKMDMWHKICFDKELIDDTVVIYRENDINELDPEVKDLVNTINKLPFTKTISSCSGHGTRSLLVGITTQHIMILEILSKIISDNFNFMFIISTGCGYIQNSDNCGFSFNLETKSIGEEAYDLTKKLRDKIEEYISNDLAKDYEKILLDEDYINKNRYKKVVGIDKEILILKNTLNGIKNVCINESIIDDKINCIHLVFYDKNILDDILKIIWDNFRKDFMLKSNIGVKYVVEDEKNRGTCLTLFFIAKEDEIIDKIRALNEILQKETKFKNINGVDEDYINENRYKKVVGIDKEILILKNTLNGIKNVCINESIIDDKINCIHLVFYDKNILDDILKIIWDNFRKDFILKSNTGVKYVVEDEKNRGTCLTLFFIAKEDEIIDKIRALNEILQKETKFKNINGVNEEVQILKNTFDEIKSVYCDGYSIDEKVEKGYIHLVFYEKNILDDILKILWESFNNDFVLKTNKFIKYVNEDTNNRGTCLTLEFMINGMEAINKIRALNEILKNKITNKK